MQYWSIGARRAWPLFALAAFILLSGFAPFNGSGLSRFTIAAGDDPVDVRDVDGGDAVETDAVFHTLSSRYGGGGALIYMEFTPGDQPYSGVLLIDLRHAGLKDLYDPQRLEMPNRKRAELFYQEWDGGGDRFESATVKGHIVVEELYRGAGASAMGIRFDLEFVDAGPDGVVDKTDRWRKVVGTATTSPTVEQALKRDAVIVIDDRETHYAPDGDITVGCFGEVEVEDEQYEEGSYTYDDDSGDACEGDTWEDDAEQPEETGGCAGKAPVDEGGEAEVDGGCEGSGPDIDDPDDDEGDDLYYDEESDDGDDGGGGCEGDDDDDDTADDSDDDTSGDDSASSGCDSDDDGPDDDYDYSDDTYDSSDSDDSASSGCEGDDDDTDDTDDATFASNLGPGGSPSTGTLACTSVASASSLPPQTLHLRRTLDRLERGGRLSPRAYRLVHRKVRRRATMISRKDYRPIRKILGYLPFFLLGLGIHVTRRRMARP